MLQFGSIMALIPVGCTTLTRLCITNLCSVFFVLVLEKEKLSCLPVHRRSTDKGTSLSTCIAATNCSTGSIRKVSCPLGRGLWVHMGSHGWGSAGAVVTYGFWLWFCISWHWRFWGWLSSEMLIASFLINFLWIGSSGPGNLSALGRLWLIFFSFSSSWFLVLPCTMELWWRGCENHVRIFGYEISIDALYL